MRLTQLLAPLVLMFAPRAHLAAQVDAPARPVVLVVATGGTIAGVQPAPGTLGEYVAGALTAEQILASVPQLSAFARVETLQFSNVPSANITPAQWVDLREACPALDSAGIFRTPWLRAIVAQHLTSQKARLLLMLALPRDRAEVSGCSIRTERSTAPATSPDVGAMHTIP